MLRQRNSADDHPRLLALPAGALAALQVITRLPCIDVSLTGSERGQAIRDYLGRRRYGLGLRLRARSVLTIPDSPEEYLAGRSRRATRTNVSRAKRQGIACVGPYDAVSAQPGVERLIANDLLNPAAVRRRSCDEWLIALDRSGDAVGGAMTTVDREWAMLSFLVGTSYDVRYALHTTLVLRLGEIGVRHLFTRGESALLLSPGLQYMQRLLGYEVRNLRLQPRGRTDSRTDVPGSAI